MSLIPGATLGAFEIVGSLGAGGMGVVYRARDTKLNRDVALKILPDALATDGERLARFTREAHILAAMNHPNIAAIYGLEETVSDAGTATSALVMELVEGEDLAQRLAREPLSHAEVLSVARQLVEALGAAHEQGIVHRDLKPANIRIRSDGVVKVLDFGLAKATAAPAAAAGGALDHSPTITSPALTALGMILGTAAYMSPEQAKGQPADKRSDIWAFGCVLFEMLTGKRAFHGDDVAETLAAVLRADVPLEALPVTTPMSIRRAVSGCLERDRRRRFGDFAVVRFLLDEAPTTASAPRRAGVRTAIVAAAALAAGTLVTFGLVTFRTAPSTPQVVRFSVPLSPGEGFPNLRSQVIAVSADGTQLGYARGGSLSLRNFADADGRRMDAGVNPQSPVFSPDGSELAFYSDGALHRLPVGGGRATRICALTEPPLGLVWVGSDLLVGGGTQGILRVAAAGGTPEQIVAVAANDSAASPELLPGGHVVLYASPSGPAEIQQRPGRILAHSLETGETKTIIDSGTTPRYLATGHLVYANGGTLYAVSFDAVRLQVTSTPVIVVEGVLQSLNAPLAQFALSQTGTLVYVPGARMESARTELAILEEEGGVKILPFPPGVYEHPRVSPDGTQVAFSFDAGQELNVFVAPITGDVAPRRLTFGGRNRFPIWSNDGQRIIFQSDREGETALFSQVADGTRPAERLSKPESGVSQVPESYSPDGRTLLFTRTTGVSVSLWSLSWKSGASEPFGGVTSSAPINATFSPDGRWVAYTTVERSVFGLYVQPFPATGGQFQVSSRQGIFPAWAHNGRELYFNFPGQLMKATVTTQPTFAVRSTVPVPAVRLRSVWPGQRSFDTAGDKRIVSVVRPQEIQLAKVDDRINVVLNWVRELTDGAR